MNVLSTALMIHEVQVRPNEKALSVVVHDVHHNDHGAPAIGAGKVLDTTAKAQILKLLSDDVNGDLEFLGERTLMQNAETLMWYRPGKKTELCFEGEMLTLTLPSLIFLLYRGTLYVRAYRGKRRPVPGTRVYTSGLPNIYAKGAWCQGNNPLPGRPTQSDVEKVETLFFQSPFAHMGDESIPELDDDDEYVAYFRELTQLSRYPASMLQDTEMSVSGWAREVIG